eukprot:COSAG02_NODE_43227_length_377_cov_0.449640_1_plen_55_part_10
MSVIDQKPGEVVGWWGGGGGRRAAERSQAEEPALAASACGGVRVAVGGRELQGPG